MRTRPDLAAYAVAAIVIAATAVIVISGHTEPTWFELVALAAVVGGAGVAQPAGQAATVDQLLGLVGQAIPPVPAAPAQAVPQPAPPVQRPPAPVPAPPAAPPQ